VNFQYITSFRRSMANVEKTRAERKSILRKHWGFLKTNFILKYISDALIQDGVITPADWMNLKQKYTVNSEMNEEFLFTLHNEKLDCFPKFVKALRVNSFGHVADVLEGRAEPGNSHFKTSSFCRNVMINYRKLKRCFNFF